jgi:hypothetical protein
MRYQIVCGSVLGTDYDYDSFNKWLNDQHPANSAVVVIDTTSWKKYMFSGDLEKLTSNSLDEFVIAVSARIKKGQDNPADSVRVEQSNNGPAKQESRKKRVEPANREE